MQDVRCLNAPLELLDDYKFGKYHPRKISDFFKIDPKAFISSNIML
jgi:hypothetical protein